MPVDLLRRVSAVLFDIDGTLLDSNAAHAETWAQALIEHGIGVDAKSVRPLVGMGADKLLPAMAHLEEASAQGQAISRRKKELFDRLLPGLSPTPGARALVSSLRDAGKRMVIATSAGEQELNALLKQAGVADLIARRTSKDDVDESKPDPDIINAALAEGHAPPDETVMIGDTPYDLEAAGRAGVKAIALRCGGYWSDTDLARAVAIFDDPAELLAHWLHD